MRLIFASLLASIIFLNMPDKKDSGDIRFNNHNTKPLFSFGIIADAQYCNHDPVGTRYYRSSSGKLREALRSLKEDSADFIINLGDIIDKDYESYESVLDIIDSSELKIYNVTGNHDYNIDPRLKTKLPVQLSSKNGYYSFVFKNFRFIFLNGNEISTYASNNKQAIRQAEDYLAAMKTRGEINAMDWNGGISKKQLNWLDRQLSESIAKNEKVFLICHFPVFPENVHNLFNYRDVLSVLNNYHNVIAWFSGHNHSGNYGNFNRIHFVTIKGMVETEDSNSFALVEVYSDKIWIKGSGREKSQELAY
ncbi:MAG: metallophosphoesterase [Bacteroidales bacterium]|nr:metallophosphoesterase [Bacteroidales bacterium]